MPLKVIHRHGSPFLYLRGSVRGIRVDRSTGVSCPKLAEEIRITYEQELLQRSIHGDAVSRTFEEAALGYLRAGGDGTHLAPLIKHFARRKVGQIGQAEIEDAARILGQGKSPSTLNRQIYTPAVAVLHYAARQKWCSKPVIARPKQPQGRIRWISYEEAERLIEAASPHMRPFVVFLLSTGARLSEALYLDWRDVDLSRGQVVFRDTKNGEDRGVPLHPRAVAALANLSHRKGAVFRRPDGKPYSEREGGGGQIKTGWRGMLKRAGMRDFTPHDCRHTWATWHYAENRDMRALMELGGWKSPEMVFRYAHVNTSHLAPSIARIWGNRGERQETGSVIALESKAK